MSNETWLQKKTHRKSSEKNKEAGKRYAVFFFSLLLSLPESGKKKKKERVRRKGRKENLGRSHLYLEQIIPRDKKTGKKKTYQKRVRRAVRGSLSYLTAHQ